MSLETMSVETMSQWRKGSKPSYYPGCFKLTLTVIILVIIPFVTLIFPPLCINIYTFSINHYHYYDSIHIDVHIDDTFESSETKNHQLPLNNKGIFNNKGILNNIYHGKYIKVKVQTQDNNISSNSQFIVDRICQDSSQSSSVNTTKSLDKQKPVLFIRDIYSFDLLSNKYFNDDGENDDGKKNSLEYELKGNFGGPPTVATLGPI